MDGLLSCNLLSDVMKRFQQINDFLNNSSFFYTIAIGMDSKYAYVSPNYNRNFDQSN